MPLQLGQNTVATGPCNDVEHIARELALLQEALGGLSIPGITNTTTTILQPIFLDPTGGDNGGPAIVSPSEDEEEEGEDVVVVIIDVEDIDDDDDNTSQGPLGGPTIVVVIKGTIDEATLDCPTDDDITITPGAGDAFVMTQQDFDNEGNLSSINWTRAVEPPPSGEPPLEPPVLIEPIEVENHSPRTITGPVAMLAHKVGLRY